jgi:hypothetical protein
MTFFQVFQISTLIMTDTQSRGVTGEDGTDTFELSEGCSTQFLDFRIFSNPFETMNAL